MIFEIKVATVGDMVQAEAICQLIKDSSKARGTGIAERQPEYIRSKIKNGNAVIAYHNGELAGFCYIEVWSHHRYVANSGLIVAPQFRGQGLAGQIKQAIFQLSGKKYPSAKIFGITTSLAVMRINTRLGYEPVTFSELTQDEAFWDGCKSCVNYDVLQRNERKLCLCTAMLAQPSPPTHDISDLIIQPQIIEHE
ncbi:MAG: GNAT family N-acetyltransferase [Bacteroidota bacterium]